MAAPLLMLTAVLFQYIRTRERERGRDSKRGFKMLMLTLSDESQSDKKFPTRRAEEKVCKCDVIHFMVGKHLDKRHTIRRISDALSRNPSTRKKIKSFLILMVNVFDGGRGVGWTAVVVND